MANKNLNKRALIVSVMVILVCFTMLIGTTFAWFTDSVESGSNVITAGNLDLEVKYTLDGENWEDLDGAKDLFQNDLWEPGHTEVVALKVTNAGSLALKYSANMGILNETVGKTEDGKDIVLSDILKVSTLTQAANDVGEIALYLAFAGENGLGYENTSSFKDGKVIRENQELHAGDSHYVIIKVDMPETVGNEANHDGVNVPTIEFAIDVLASQLNYEEDSFGPDYDKETVLPTVVYNITDLQNAVDNATGKAVIELGGDITGDLVVTQKPNVEITIEGKGFDYKGVILVDGKSATYKTAALTIKDLNFNADSISADACIRLGNGTNATRYTCNVTVSGCTFDVTGAVAVKSYTGGDKNLTIVDCTVTDKAHSLVQAKGIDGVLVEKCTVNSKNGLNFNNSTNVVVSNCTVEVRGYAVRFGEGSAADTNAEVYTIKDCTLATDGTEGDKAVILRGTAANATLTIENTTIVGDINNSTNATVIK